MTIEEKIEKLSLAAKYTLKEAEQELKDCNWDLDLCLDRLNKKKLNTDQVNLIKQLRTKTNMSIKDCHKALDLNKWNLDEALNYMKTKMADILAQKRAEKEVKCGLIFVKKVSNNLIKFFKLLCETDFVERNEKFTQLGEKLMEMSEVDENLVKEYSAALGEKIVCESIEKFEGSNVYFYIHSRNNNGFSGTRIGLIDLSKPLNEEINIAQQIVAFPPKSKEEFLEQPWFLNSSETVKGKLNDCEVIKYKYESILGY
jgi:translation elongation factor EF-Ts